MFKVKVAFPRLIVGRLASASEPGCTMNGHWEVGTSEMSRYGDGEPAGTKRPVGAAADGGTMTFTRKTIGSFSAVGVVAGAAGGRAD